MKLLSFIPTSKTMDHFDGSWKNINNYIKELGLDGIETMIGTYHPTSYLSDANVIGLHLLYFPTWLDLWREDIPALEENFGSLERVKECFGGTTKDILIDHYKKEFENAKLIGVKYMVFHVSHVNPRDIFTFNFSYTSREVIESTVELINEVFKGDGPLLLLENLFWPGLDLSSNESTRYLLDSINYKNKGLLLDTSHLICMNKNISTYDEGADYILNKLEELGDLVDYIYGIHLNASTPSIYLRNDFSDHLSRWNEANTLERYNIEIEHIKNIDTHSVFKSSKLKKILEKIPYQFLTLELSYDSIDDLQILVKEQLNYIK